MEERLKATPELVNLPQDVQSLLTSVASFGSQIRDLNTTVTVLKNENSQLQEASKTLFENVTYIKVSTGYSHILNIKSCEKYNVFWQISG